MCIPKEEYIKLRYLIVFGATSGQGINITTDKLGLESHYRNYIGKLKTKDELELQTRIMNRMEQQAKEMDLPVPAIIDKEETKSKSTLHHNINNFDGDIAEAFVSKTTGETHVRLWHDYTSLITSDNLKVVAVSLKGTNCYIWKVIIDAQKHLFNEKLKEDFHRIGSLNNNVIVKHNL